MNQLLIKQLFLKYYLSTFKLGEVILDQVENLDNYQEILTLKTQRQTQARELVLVIKSVSYDSNKDEFFFPISRAEQDFYKTLYPANSVFYVTCCYKTFEQLHQMQIDAKSSDVFLRAFPAISAHSLDSNTMKVYYESFNFETSKPKPFFIKNGNPKKLDPDEYTKANLLSKMLKQGQVGASLERLNKNINQLESLTYESEVINEIVQGMTLVTFFGEE